MAEIAAGAYLASEVIEHGAQAGYAAYLVSKPTLPLKATFTRIATAGDDHTKCVPSFGKFFRLTLLGVH
jgi:hypothetical protein